MRHTVSDVWAKHKLRNRLRDFSDNVVQHSTMRAQQWERAREEGETRPISHETWAVTSHRSLPHRRTENAQPEPLDLRPVTVTTLLYASWTSTRYRELQEWTKKCVGLMVMGGRACRRCRRRCALSSLRWRLQKILMGRFQQWQRFLTMWIGKSHSDSSSR